MIGIINGVFTLALIIIFLAICVWAWSRHNTEKFHEMAHLPLVDDDGLLTEKMLPNQRSKGTDYE